MVIPVESQTPANLFISQTHTPVLRWTIDTGMRSETVLSVIAQGEEGVTGTGADSASEAMNPHAPIVGIYILFGIYFYRPLTARIRTAWATLKKRIWDHSMYGKGYTKVHRMGHTYWEKREEG
jgi:hypothetical protein